MQKAISPSKEVKQNIDCFPISVIIPAYNSSKFIEKTLKSVINQTINNFEIIVVDDGSNDNTYAIVENIFQNVTTKDTHLELLHQSNAGESAARNYGLQYARGEYVLFFDSDDMMEPECIEKINSIIQSQKYDAVIFGIDFLNENGQLFFKYNDKYSYFENEISGLEVIKLYFSSKLYICVENIIYKRKLIYNNQLNYTVGCKHGPDIEFIVKGLLHSQRVICLQESLVKYVHREGSVSRDISNIFEAIETLNRLSTYLRKNKIQSDVINLLETKKIPETYCSILLTHIQAGCSVTEIIDIMANYNIIPSLKKYKATALKYKIICFLLIHYPTLFIIIARIKIIYSKK